MEGDRCRTAAPSWQWPYLRDSDREKRAAAALERFRAVTSDLAFKQELLDLVVDSPPSLSRARDPQSIRSADAPRIVPNAFSVRATMDRQRIRALAASLPGVETSRFKIPSP